MKEGHMKTTAKQYKTVVNNATEITQVFLDMESGNYVLAMFRELVQELLDEGNISGASSVVRKLHAVAEVPIEQVLLGESNAAIWVTLFAETLNDILEESAFSDCRRL